ncbi:MAG TPA: hypothetical protein VND97_06885, partial [Beijerinckiaceae bacterium]|nr:hypothetical protein [Beijerinckiaceae bacterium]
APAGNDAFAQRFWPSQHAPAPFDVAGADMTTTGSVDEHALAYAVDEPASNPMGERLSTPLPPLVPAAFAAAGAEPLTMEAKSLLGTPMAIGGQQLSSPWIRAAMLTPSVSETMTVSRLGGNDPRLLQDLFYKPAQMVTMSFADDPQTGMTADRFSGDAVVFLATTRFVPQQTASLQ